MTQIFKLSAEELLDLYGIELREDKTVYDPVEDRVFKNIVAWDTFIKQQENDGNYGGTEKFGGGKYAYDDEY